MRTRQIHLYPLVCMGLNLILGFILARFNKIYVANYDSMGFAYPSPTVWVLRFEYIYYLLTVFGAGLLCLSLIGKISGSRIFGLAFGIVVIDVGLLFISALGYSMPFLNFLVSVE